MLLGFLMAATAFVAAACHPVASDRILARDLAAVRPEFSALPPEQFLSYAPIPGQRRIFMPAELARIAHNHGLDASFTDPECFAWEANPLSRDAVLAAMKDSFTDTPVDLEILDQAAIPVPPGRLSFPLSGISPSADGPVLWRGSVLYRQNRSLSIWARVRITVHEQDVVAAEPMRPGEPVTLTQLRLQPYNGPYRREKNFSDLQQVVGLMPTTMVNAGTALNRRVLRETNAVERGDTVQVVVLTANTRIEVAGIAEESGARGAWVLIRNARSGRKFRARVEDRDKVSVQPNNALGLTGEDSKS